MYDCMLRIMIEVIHKAFTHLSIIKFPKEPQKNLWEIMIPYSFNHGGTEDSQYISSITN